MATCPDCGVVIPNGGHARGSTSCIQRKMVALCERVTELYGQVARCLGVERSLRDRLRIAERRADDAEQELRNRDQARAAVAETYSETCETRNSV